MRKKYYFGNIGNDKARFFLPSVAGMKRICVMRSYKSTISRRESDVIIKVIYVARARFYALTQTQRRFCPVERFRGTRNNNCWRIDIVIRRRQEPLRPPLYRDLNTAGRWVLLRDQRALKIESDNGRGEVDNPPPWLARYL